jgi:thioesterase domain-containing protein
MYGITETTVHVTWRLIRRADVAAGAGSVIGGPIPGWQVHLLGADSRPVADGEVGEMYVGGRGVARGYLNRPDLTAERFLPDPNSRDPAARLYRSGDLARRLPDGDLVYMGRIDHQVKIRGFRIELVEVETALARHPAVREAAVLAREDVPGEKRLVAYVVGRQVGNLLSSGKLPTCRPTQSPAPTAAELRSFLRQRLPDYMVPAAFVPLESLPMTAHGKVNREALPPPGCQRADAQPEPAGPLTPCQRRLQEMWENLLHVRPVGVRDNFFDLGGDSLLAMNLCLEIKKAFGQEVSPACWFQEATVERLAEILSRQGPSPWSAVVPLQPHGKRPPFFCVHPLGGQVVGYRLIARYLGDDQPFYGIQARPPHEAPEAVPRLEDMAARYVAEVVRVHPEGPYYLGGYSLGAFIAFEMAQQLHRQGRLVGLLAVLDDGPALIHDPWALSVREVGFFLANLPHWLLHQICRRGPKELSLDVWRKLKVWARKLFRPAPPHGVDVEEALDVSRYSEAYRQHLAANYRALKDYVPQVYPDRITVFRARTQPLLGSHQPDLGWSRRAGGGTAVHVIRGDHNSLVVEPNVRLLGARLGACLREAQEANGGHGPDG